MTFDQLYEQAEIMQRFLEEDIPTDNPNVLVNRLSTINTYLACSGKALADAKLLQDKEIVFIYQNNSNYILSLSPSIAKRYVESLASAENHLVNWIERINRTLVHIGDNVRTQISFAKEELRLTKQGY